jgi:hypothetical protein
VTLRGWKGATGGFIFNNELYLITSLIPALYAGGLEADNQISMGTYGVVSHSLGVGRSDLLGILSQGVNNSFNGISGELSSRLTFGAQASILFLPEPVIVPYIRGGIGIDINLGSLILWEGKGSTSNGVSTRTSKDNAFVQNFGISTVFAGFEMERIAMPYGNGDSWSITSSAALGLLTIQLNSEGNLSIGMLPRAKFATGFGAEITYQFNFINYKLW